MAARPAEARHARLREVGIELIRALGDDPCREGLKETPRRFADWWESFIAPIPNGTLDTTFTSVSTDQLVTVHGMRVWSICEHHLLPFWTDVAIGYLASSRILGLSKFARIAWHHAHKLQLQERLAEDIANHVSRVTGSEHVAVLLKGEHLCMTMRGIRTPHLMSTSVMRGHFRDKPEARAEFLSMVS